MENPAMAVGLIIEAEDQNFNSLLAPFYSHCSGQILDKVPVGVSGVMEISTESLPRGRAGASVVERSRDLYFSFSIYCGHDGRRKGGRLHGLKPASCNCEEEKRRFTLGAR